MTVDLHQPWHLQLLGRPIDGGPWSGPPRPIGQRVYLQPGTIADDGDGLGPTNHGLIPLEPALFCMPTLLEGYQLYEHPDGNAIAAEWRIGQQLLLNDQRLEAIPPCAIQLNRTRQPAFAVSALERNPCPAWAERIHLYQSPGKPFEATAVIYLNSDLQVAAAELFHVALRPLGRSGDYQPTRRVWIQYSY